MVLLFGNTVAGEIVDAFEHQGTQFGIFKSRLSPNGDRTTERLREFIKFCKDWFGRCGSEAGADASEFDQFPDIVSSGNWSIQETGGKLSKIQDAPMFQNGLDGEISWVWSLKS
jgi:hypothetical protein